MENWRTRKSWKSYEMPNKYEMPEKSTLFFNELMNMIDGDLAMPSYIAQDVKRSGLEIWRIEDAEMAPIPKEG